MVLCALKRQLSDDERSVLLSELLLRHRELVAEAEETTSALLVVETIRSSRRDHGQAAGAARERPVSVDTGWRRVLDVLQPYIDDLTRRKERGARRAAADIAIAVLLGLYRPEILPGSRSDRHPRSSPSTRTCSLVRKN